MVISSPRASSPSFRVPQGVPFGDLHEMVKNGDMERALEEIVSWVRSSDEVLAGVMAGKINTVETLTLTASVASTTITSPIISGQTMVILMPTTANAAAEIGNGTLYQTYPNATKGQAVINHASNAQVDRIYICAFLG